MLRAAIRAGPSPVVSVLLEVSFDERHVPDAVEQLLKQRLSALATTRYGRAVVVALVLRHSWREDDIQGCAASPPMAGASQDRADGRRRCRC